MEYKKRKEEKNKAINLLSYLFIFRYGLIS